MRILVLRGGALGDFLVTLPALATLRARWPGARLELIGHATAAALALDAGLIDAAHSQHDRRWSALESDTPLPADLAAWLHAFDLVINFWPDPYGQLARHFPRHDRQHFLTAGAHPTTAPAAAHFCRALQPLGVAPTPLLHPLRTWRPNKTTIAIHPGSGSARKNWPLPRWRELCADLRSRFGAHLLVITGEAEPDGLLADLGSPLRCLPLNALADQLARCRLFVGHDSGVSHLAAACGTPCVLLFGPTDPAVWAPPTAHVRAIQRGAMLEIITVADVSRVILEVWPSPA